jgi:hypothetical protein
MVANQEAMKDAVAKEWASYDRMLSSWNEGFRFHCDDCGARTKKTRHLTPAGLPCASDGVFLHFDALQPHLRGQCARVTRTCAHHREVRCTLFRMLVLLSLHALVCATARAPSGREEAGPAAIFWQVGVSGKVGVTGKSGRGYQ